MNKLIQKNPQDSRRENSRLKFTAPNLEDLQLKTVQKAVERTEPAPDKTIIDYVVSLGGAHGNETAFSGLTPFDSPETDGTRQPGDTEKQPDGQSMFAFVKAEKDVESAVRLQYEQLPYPLRDAENDKKYLLLTMIDNLMLVNQSCYRGKRNFSDGFQVLVAGGGTGDAMLYLAVQLAWIPGAKIHYIDLSAESMRIAKERLHNQSQRLGWPALEKIVDFRIASLLDVESLAIGKFDYINCSGVLHHLKDPNEGLKALRAVLKDDGAMGLMVYGKIGRSSIYPMQELMRLVNRNAADTEEKIRNTNLILSHLPASNPHRRNGRWLANDANPVEIYDLFLHSQDRAFNIDELYDWVDASGLNVCGFSSGLPSYMDVPTLSMQLPSKIRKLLEKMTPREIARFAELHLGHFNKYEFHVSPEKHPGIDMDDWDIVPAFSYFARIQSLPSQAGGENAEGTIRFKVDTHYGQVTYTLENDALLQLIFENINDRTNMREMTQKAQSNLPGLSPEKTRGIIMKRLEKLIQCNMIHFRHPAGDVTKLNWQSF